MNAPYEELRARLTLAAQEFYQAGARYYAASHRTNNYRPVGEVVHLYRTKAEEFPGVLLAAEASLLDSGQGRETVKASRKCPKKMLRG